MKYQLTNKVVQDDYTKYLADFYDLQDVSESKVTINANLEGVPNDFNIGVIYGGSGTGKTTILKKYFNQDMNDKPVFDNNIPVISNFDWLSPEDASRLLSSMGFSTVPNWLTPFDKLSNGQQARAELAYVIGRAKEQDLVLYDEFTSVVDRNVAKAMANSLQKYVRRHNKKIVLASCHFDIIPWLKPDWIYSPENGKLEIAPRHRRENIELKIVRARYEAWDIFHKHHYMSADLNKAASCYMGLIDDVPVTFNAVLPFPHGHIQNGFRMSRIVVQPDYQGLGIGSRVTDYISSLYKKANKTMYIKSSNPALWNYWDKSHNWNITNQQLKEDAIKKNERLRAQGHTDPIKFFRESTTKSVKWIGDVSHISEQETQVIKFNASAWKDVAQNQISLF